MGRKNTSRLLLTLELNDVIDSKVLVYKQNKGFLIWKTGIVNGTSVSKGKAFASFQLYNGEAENYLRSIVNVPEEQVTLKEMEES